MSLVLEALRRIEKPDGREGSIAVALTPHRSAMPRRGLALPLVLGLVTGAAIVLVFSPPVPAPIRSAADSDSEGRSVARPLKGRAGLPPPLFVESESPLLQGSGRDRSGATRSSGQGALPAIAPSPPPHPPLVLQAISERDSHPIAIINDLLVKEGDRLGPVRILRIGSESVEVLLGDGTRDTVRFAPPPPDPTPTATPDRF